MALPQFCFNDETKKNSLGFYLLNQGGRFARFTDNPVMLYNHNSDRLVGRWENLHTEGSRLICDPVFDEGVELGAQCKGQVERGFLRGVSPGIFILKAEWRPNAEGSDDLYVTEWELVEGSVTSVPSNAGALSLMIYTADNQAVDEKDIKLHIDGIVKLSAEQRTKDITIKTMDKITLSAEAYVALGIKQDAAPEALSAAIVALSVAKAAAEKELAEHKTAAAAAAKANAEATVDLAIKEGRITTESREDYIQLSLTNPALAQRTLQSLPVKKSLSAGVHKISDNVIPTERSTWTHLHWLKEDPEGLAKLKAEHPDAYKAITHPEE